MRVKRDCGKVNSCCVVWELMQLDRIKGQNKKPEGL